MCADPCDRLALHEHAAHVLTAHLAHGLELNRAFLHRRRGTQNAAELERFVPDLRGNQAAA